MMPLPRGSVIKRCGKGAFAGLTWKVDEFAGDNKGLVIAKVELAHEHARGAALGRRGGDGQGTYRNGSFAQRPFITRSTRLAQLHSK